MLAAETTEGLERLGIVHHTTLPYSPEQNGKQESFWGQIEGRLCRCSKASSSSPSSCSTSRPRRGSSRSTTAQMHTEIKETPLERYLAGPTVGRDSPSSDALRRAFRMEVSRIQRRSDGTVTVEGVRFEVPSAYRTLIRAPRPRRAMGPLERRPRRPALRARTSRRFCRSTSAKNAERVRRVLAPRATRAAPRRARRASPRSCAP